MVEIAVDRQPDHKGREGNESKRGKKREGEGKGQAGLLQQSFKAIQHAWDSHSAGLLVSVLHLPAKYRTVHDGCTDHRCRDSFASTSPSLEPCMIASDCVVLNCVVPQVILNAVLGHHA